MATHLRRWSRYLSSMNGPYPVAGLPTGRHLSLSSGPALSSRAESDADGPPVVPAGLALAVFAQQPEPEMAHDDEGPPHRDAWYASFGTSVSRVLSLPGTARQTGRKPARGAAEAVLESVIAKDDRIRVDATAEPPFSWVCDLSITARNGTRWLGTGWLASPRLVITAGHCVYMHNAGGWAQQVRVSPGRNAGDDDPSFESTTVMSVAGWVRDRDDDCDYGAIILPATANALGWFGYSVRSDTALDNDLANVVGYPSDKPAGTMWGNVHRLSTPEPAQLLYLNDTYGGMSGAPVIEWDGTDYSVLGIHNYGDLSGNRATRITAEVFHNIQGWAASISRA